MMFKPLGDGWRALAYRLRIEGKSFWCARRVNLDTGETFDWETSDPEWAFDIFTDCSFVSRYPYWKGLPLMESGKIES